MVVKCFSLTSSDKGPSSSGFEETRLNANDKNFTTIFAGSFQVMLRYLTQKKKLKA